MRKTSSECALCHVVLTVALSVAMVAAAPNRAALAQPRSDANIEHARELFNRGLDLRDSGDRRGALEALKAAHAIGNTPITALELGRAYDALDGLVEARSVFLSIVRIAPEPRETMRSAAARKRGAELAEALLARIPALRVTVVGATPASVNVTLDGSIVQAKALDAPLAVNPGRHRIVATMWDGRHVEATVYLKEGDIRTVELGSVAPGNARLPVLARPTVEVPPVAPRANLFAHGAFALAAAGTILGAATGAMALSRASAVKERCHDTNCPRGVDADLQSGRALATVSTVAFATAGVSAVAGVVAVLMPRSERSSTAPEASLTLSIGVGGAALCGSF